MSINPSPPYLLEMSSASTSLTSENSDSDDVGIYVAESHVQPKEKTAPMQASAEGPSWIKDGVPRLGRQVSRYPTMVGTKLKTGIGYRIRKVVYAFDEALMPFVHKLIPNFIVAHYAYIIMWVIVGSVLLYAPAKSNIRYIDAVFFAAGASTQSGLNTININDLTLFQQIVIYCLGMFTTPIFIHGSLVFLRIYWFQKTIDNIKEKSMHDFKMRRSATLAAIRTQTTDHFRADASALGEPGYNTHNAQEELGTRLQKYNENNNAGDADAEKAVEDDTMPPPIAISSPAAPASPVKSPLSPTESSKNATATDADSEDSSDGNSNDFSSEKSDDDDDDDDDADADSDDDDDETDSSDETDQSDLAGAEDKSEHTKEVAEKAAEAEGKKLDAQGKETVKQKLHDEFGQSDESPTHQKDIQFADLPHPSKRRRGEMDPRDLYMSISMMQHKNKRLTDPEAENGPVLHINGPAEREHILPLRPRRRRLRRLRLQKQKQQQKDLADKEIKEMKDTDDELEKNSENEPEGRKNTKIQFQEPELRHRASVTGSESVSTGVSDTDSQGSNHHSGAFAHLSRKFTHNLTGHTTQSMNPEEMSDNELIRNYGRTVGLTRQKTNYLSWNPTVGRNSTFVAVNDDQIRELGGVEYRALRLLAVILIAYYVGFHLLNMTFYLPFILHMKHYREIVEADGISPTWWAFFTAATMFNDVGFALTPDSMISFAQNAYVLIVGSFFMVIGNTGFPIFLRFIIWIMQHLSKPLTMFNESLCFLMEHPRRCFTLLFPSGPTWWLFAVLVILNCIDWMLFIILDFRNSTLASIPGGYRVVDGLFQAFSTRTCGLAVVNLAQLHTAIQVSYMVMMYISVLPMAISIRRTNVYEEQSLGVYLDDGSQDDDESQGSKNKVKSFIGAHLRRQLSFDLWFIFLGLFIICLCENSKLKSGDYYFQVFDILFEIVSAYGTVGMSLGYPTSNCSFSVELTSLSKLIIVFMMIRGRHRGLPYSIDRAVMLNKESLKQRDEIQAYRTLRRTQTVNEYSQASTGGSASRNSNSTLESYGESTAGDRARHKLKRAAKLTKSAFRNAFGGPGAGVDASANLHALTVASTFMRDNTMQSRSATSRSSRTNTTTSRSSYSTYSDSYGSGQLPEIIVPEPRASNTS